MQYIAAVEEFAFDFHLFAMAKDCYSEGLKDVNKFEDAYTNQPR